MSLIPGFSYYPVVVVVTVTAYVSINVVLLLSLSQGSTENRLSTGTKVGVRSM